MKIAAIQFTAGINWLAHREGVMAQIREAAQQGSQFIATPENTGGIMADKTRFRAEALAESDHPAVADFSALAKKLHVHLLCGSVAVRVEGSDKLANRSLLFAPDGRIAARYDKIHLFDVDLPTGESHRESANFMPGDRAVTAPLGDMSLGLSVCYDVRFAALYRALAKAGANLLAVPSAFTVPTGQAHWHVLLRARAIETGSYVIAPAQTGTHDGGRKTYGHSLIISPWGEVLAEAGDQPGIIYADVNAACVQQVRASLPSLSHDRPFSV